VIDPVDVARRFRAENDRERDAIGRRRAQAQTIGRELADALVASHPDVKKVWGFGSTFETWRAFRMDSDIDLAVEAGNVLELSRLVEDCGFPVDLVDLGECPCNMAEFIRSQGVLLAEAGK
jgi:predicted nucleotidyltransferase